MIEFKQWPKTPRLFRDAVITEKIDGTNAAVQFIFVPEENRVGPIPPNAIQGYEGDWYLVGAQSRKRIITPDSDNYGFARWVHENFASLFVDLGPGVHFGEWWGQGIQRRYDLDHKRFSLFNTAKWSDKDFQTPGLHTVPVLFEGEAFDTTLVRYAIQILVAGGSMAAPGFMNPEGVCVYHTASGQVYKALIENDDIPKSQA